MGFYPANAALLQQQQQAAAAAAQQQQQNSQAAQNGVPSTNGHQPPPRPRGAATPNGNITPDQQAAAQQQAAAFSTVFPGAFVDPSGALVRMPGAPANLAAGMRLIAPNPTSNGGHQPLNLPGQNSLGYGGANGTNGSGPLVSSSSLLPGFSNGARRDSMDRAAAFSPTLDKAKVAAGLAAAPGWPYGGLGGAGVPLGSVTPPPANLFNASRLNAAGAPGADRFRMGGGGINLFGSNSNLFPTNGKNRHNSIDSNKAPTNRSKLLEDFR